MRAAALVVVLALTGAVLQVPARTAQATPAPSAAVPVQAQLVASTLAAGSGPGAVAVSPTTHAVSTLSASGELTVSTTVFGPSPSGTRAPTDTEVVQPPTGVVWDQLLALDDGTVVVGQSGSLRLWRVVAPTDPLFLSFTARPTVVEDTGDWGSATGVAATGLNALTQGDPGQLYLEDRSGRYFTRTGTGAWSSADPAPSASGTPRPAVLNGQVSTTGLLFQGDYDGCPVFVVGLDTEVRTFNVCTGAYPDPYRFPALGGGHLRVGGIAQDGTDHTVVIPTPDSGTVHVVGWRAGPTDTWGTSDVSLGAGAQPLGLALDFYHQQLYVTDEAAERVWSIDTFPGDPVAWTVRTASASSAVQASTSWGQPGRHVAVDQGAGVAFAPSSRDLLVVEDVPLITGPVSDPLLRWNDPSSSVVAAVKTTVLSKARGGAPYSEVIIQALSNVLSMASYTTGLPPGLAISPTGLVQGTATRAGSFEVVPRSHFFHWPTDPAEAFVYNADGTFPPTAPYVLPEAGLTNSAAPLELVVEPGTPVFSSPAALVPAAWGVPVVRQVTATWTDGQDYPAAWTQPGYTAATGTGTSQLPPGLTLDPATGSITGTPTASGTYTFDVTASTGRPATGSGLAAVPQTAVQTTTLVVDPVVPVPNSVTGPASGGLRVVFDPPSTAPGAVTGYQYSTDDGTTWLGLTATPTGSGAALTADLGTQTGAGTPALAVGATYPVRLRALTASGPCDTPSSRVSGTVTAAASAPSVPGAVSALAATAGPASALLTFTPPTTGGAVTGYQYALGTPGPGATWLPLTTTGTTTLTATASPLPAGAPVVVSVRATGPAGPGPSTSAAAVTPTAPPSPPSTPTPSPSPSSSPPPLSSLSSPARQPLPPGSTPAAGAPAPPVSAAGGTTRIGGETRVETAVELSRNLWPSEGTAPAVVLASASVAADGVAGSRLAQAAGGPVLLTPPGALSTATSDELERVLVPGGTVYVLGGAGAVSRGVEEQVVRLDPSARVVRVAGADRYATSVAVATEVRRLGGATGPVYLASGTDASMAAPLASLTDGVVLLVDGDRLPASVSTYLASAPPASVTPIGGPAARAVPSAAARAVVGADRYATSAQVADAFVAVAAASGRTPTAVAVATGTVWPDTVTGGAGMAQLGGPLLLTDPAALRGPQRDAVARLVGTRTALVIGGERAVSAGVEGDLRGLGF